MRESDTPGATAYTLRRAGMQAEGGQRPGAALRPLESVSPRASEAEEPLLSAVPSATITTCNGRK